MFASLVLALFTSNAVADISVSRSIDSVMSGASGTVTLDSGCANKDQYGSNNCDLKWGNSYTVTIDANNAEDLNGKANIAVDMKVDNIIPFKITCPVCGANCTFEVPVVKTKETIQLPPCPIAKGEYKQMYNFTLPSKSPVPVKTSAKGTVKLNDDAGNNVASLSVNAVLE